MMKRAFSELPWQARWVNLLPGDTNRDNYIRQVRAIFYSEVTPTAVREPKLVGWSEPLAQELGIAKPTTEDKSSLELLAGNHVLPSMRPYAARYGGHQFGNWAGQLGDGRAITLGEVLTANQKLTEFQLKGAGPTPYSRRADGRAVLRSSVREFLCSEAMHALGVPTTRALSLVSTGDAVVRDLFYDGNPMPEPGAIVCRVSPSFVRFGNFEILTTSKELGLLKALADQVIRDHYPELDARDPDIYGKLLDEVSKRTARMVVEWMRVGFVHGVMNTDNMSILGLTLDYGPYGWLEPYEPNWTPNTTDAEGRRYCYGNQPGIAQWNLARLCEAFIPLVADEERLHLSLVLYKTTFQEAYAAMMASKLGLSVIETELEQKLVEDLFTLLETAETDYTIFFRALSNGTLDKEGAFPTCQNFLQLIQPAFYSTPIKPELAEAWSEWSQRYSDRIKKDIVADPAAVTERTARMKKVNPKYVLRNYLAQTAILAAEKNDFSLLDRLFRVLQSPYDELPEDEDLAAKRPEWARNAPGCSALSCSS
jgi:uncharacterized protein YdiU (UPF0061 family)